MTKQNFKQYAKKNGFTVTFFKPEWITDPGKSATGKQGYWSKRFYYISKFKTFFYVSTIKEGLEIIKNAK